MPGPRVEIDGDRARIVGMETSHLPALEIATRIPRLQEALADAGVDFLLVTNLTNVRYLSGFTGSAGRLLVSDAGVVLLTDGRYGEQAEAQLAGAGVVADLEVAGDAGQRAALEARLKAGAGRRLGLESTSVTWAAQRSYAELIDPLGGEAVPTEGLVEQLRRRKDAGEVARIEAAAAIADAALAQVRSRLAEGPSEAEFGLELDTAMRRLGADDLSFETIVAAGSNGARPHHRPSSRQITAGDMVVLDFGALVDGYHSDMTRTVVVGEPTPTAARMFEVVLAAQAAGVEAVRAGALTGEVDAACRSVIAEAGWADAFVHSTGHGVGLDIHEAPWVADGKTDALEADHVVTVEPGVYLSEHGGVRIEDSVVVTDSGCRVLTNTAKQFHV